MEPEILFRGKRLDNGEWVYGWYCKYAFGRWPIKSCIIPSKQAENGCVEHVEVDPATIGQYTGLTDKNGVKIFEGDIVRFADLRNRDSMHQVIYEGWRWNLSNFYETGYDCPCCGFSEGTGCMEIIGNIHDNPELLRGAG